MIICVSGLAGSGKNTVGEIVAKKLNLDEVKLSFKDEAKRENVDLMTVQKEATKNESYDRELDREIVKRAKKGNCVVMTWLGPWIVKNADLRVWLNVSERERAKRVARRDRMSLKKALEHIRKRDDNNRRRYRRYYGIDIMDHSIFDLEINSDVFNPQQIAGIVIKAAEAKRAGRR
ncbi:cytidylate kinase family protein [Candidatus Micrarchaeota archaeon]|nr:cytidylate kinase family protein [Candidatus Micrarchaeota archaeon]